MQPFGDVTVLDFTREVAGPHCTQLLAAFGADVIKFEPPDGDRAREEWIDAFASFNRYGKRSLSVDLKTDEGRRIAATLADDADVVVENFRPGVLERFGLDYESVRATNKDVIYCSISGFGQDGPYRDYPAYDPIAQALSGLMARTGHADGPPSRIGASVIDCGTAVHAAFFVAAALRERDRTGEGRYIDTSLFDTAVSWMSYVIAQYSRTGRVPERVGRGFGPTDRIYAAEGGETFYLKVITRDQYARLCRAFDRPDLLADERFHTATARREHAAALERELTALFGNHSRDAIVDRLIAASVSVGPVHDVSEVVESDLHVRSEGMLERTPVPTEAGTLSTAALPLRTDEGRLPGGGAPPARGEHNEPVLAELGYSAAEIDRLYERGVVHGG